MADIRLAQPADLPHLPEIEQQAATLFEPYGLGELFAAETVSLGEYAQYQREGRLWVAVADGKPVGFIIASTVEADAHINEVDVLPAYGGQGIGRALVEMVCVWAKAQQHPRITLSTQANVPWNAPFYAKLGFTVLPESDWTPAYHALRQHEIDMGLPVQDRVFMVRSLA